VRIVPIEIQPPRAVKWIVMKGKKSVEVAVLSAKDFYAPVDVDAASLTFGRTGDEASLISCDRHAKDVNGDGLPDLVCSFSVTLTGFQPGDIEGVLKGRTILGTSFTGSDTVTIVPGKK